MIPLLVVQPVSVRASHKRHDPGAGLPLPRLSDDLYLGALIKLKSPIGPEARPLSQYLVSGGARKNPKNCRLFRVR